MNLEKEAKFRDAVETAKELIKSPMMAAGAMNLTDPNYLAGVGVRGLVGAGTGATVGAGLTGGQVLYDMIRNGEMTKEEIKENLKSNMSKGAITGGVAGVSSGIGGAFSKEAKDMGLVDIVLEKKAFFMDALGANSFEKTASEYNALYYDELDKVAEELAIEEVIEEASDDPVLQQAIVQEIMEEIDPAEGHGNVVHPEDVHSGEIAPEFFNSDVEELGQEVIAAELMAMGLIK